MPIIIIAVVAVGGVGFFMMSGGTPQTTTQTTSPSTTTAITTTTARNPRANVTGYVTDAAGNPLTGATVHLGGMSGLQVTTDADGYYEFEVAKEERDFDMIVEMAGYHTESATVHVTATGVVAQDFVLTAAGDEPVTVKFSLTVPYTQADDEFSIAFGDEAPAAMERVNDVTWTYLKESTAGTDLAYNYLANGSAVGGTKSVAVVFSQRLLETRDMPDWPNVDEMNHQKVNDYIPFAGNGLDPGLELGQGFFDLWGIDYNKVGMENTSDVAGPSMERMKDRMNATWVLLTDFAEYTALDPLPVIGFVETGLHPVNTVTQEEMDRFVQQAHSLGMKVIVNIGAWPVDGVVNTGEERSREWLDAAWQQWTNVMVAEAEKAEQAGVDALQVRPRGDVWGEGDDYAYTSEKIRTLVEDVRGAYGGQVAIGLIDILDVNEPSSLESLTMWDAADFIYADITGLDVTSSDRPSISEMQPVFEAALAQRLEPAASAYGKKVMLHVQFQSYVGAIREQWVEPGDKYPDLVRDWQQQADAYEALLRALEGKSFVSCLMSVGYWWDDAMDPFTANNSPSIGQTVRGKLAEAVLGKWFAAG